MRVILTGGAYQSRALLPSAQRMVNLYPEVNPQEAQPPVPVTHYPTPGLRALAQAPNVASVRQVYRATNGDLYACVGTNVYYITPSFAFQLLGSILDQPRPVSFSDNGLVIVLVDGTANGYAIDMVSRQFGKITDPDFLGADFVDFIDTFFVFNQPGTANLYISLSEVNFAMLTQTANAFDPLDIAAKSGSADPIQRVIVFHRQVWPIGALTTEAWIDSGAADFALQPLPGVFIEHGCAAKYSIASQDNSGFWLSQDRQGKAVVVKTTGYNVERISTHAIEAIFQSYTIISDAIGYVFQQNGHAFYALSFPSANATWVYDIETKQWLEWASIDSNGNLNRHRSNCCCFAYGLNIVGDFQNGNLYALDSNVFTDNGQPIPRIRSFPHMIEDGARVTYKQFVADMQVGTDAGTVTSAPPMVSLRWSDDRGATFGNAVQQSFGAAGQYLTQVTWWRCGMGRDRVFELSWSAPVNTSLNGAFVEMEKHKT